MNIFQVMNRRSTTRFLSMKDKLGLMGARLGTKNMQGPHKPHLHLSNARASQFGIMENPSEHEALQKIIRDSIEPGQFNLHAHKKFTISSKNRPKIFFDTLMDFLPIVSLISSMYFLSFKSLDRRDLIFDNFLWAIFIIDFVLTFFSQYIDNKKRTVKNIKLISLNYAKGLMIPDFIAIIPLRFGGHFRAECILRLCRIVRVPNVFKLVNISKISNQISEFLYKEQPMQKRKLKLKIYAMWSIFQQVMKIFFISFILASLWFAYVEYINRKELEENDFITNFALDEDNQIKRFIKTWYFMFTTLATVGYGDFYAVNKYEQVFAIVLLLAGPTWFAFAMGNAIGIINSMQDLSGKNANKAVLQKWLSSLTAAFEDIPYELKDKIIGHFLNLWKNDRLGSIANDCDEGSFDIDRQNDPYFSMLPDKAKISILEYLFSDLYYSHLIFFRSFPNAKYDIARFLQPRVYKRKSIIINYKSPIYELLLVTVGITEIAIHKEFDKDEPVHNCQNYCRIALNQISNKLVLGDYFAMKNINSTFEFSAYTTVKGFAIPVFAFKEILKHHNLTSKRYESIISNVYENINKIMNEELRVRPQETHEIDRFSISPGKGFNTQENEIYEICENGNRDDEDKRDAVDKEFDLVEKLLVDCNVRRKKLLSQLKEKITLTVFSRIFI